MEASRRRLDRSSRISESPISDKLPVEEAFRVLWSMPEDSNATADNETVNTRD